MTYSILGYDASNGDLGVAVQSKFPGVGSVVPECEAEVGVVATQGFGNPRHGSAGLMLLKCGATPQQAIDVLLSRNTRGAASPRRRLGRHGPRTPGPTWFHPCGMRPGRLVAGIVSPVLVARRSAAGCRVVLEEQCLRERHVPSRMR
jgi:hypothetical protein